MLPLPYSEIDAWTRLYRIRLKSWEIDMLTMLDDIWLDVMRRKSVTAEDLKGEDSADD